jgi:hypothetical protein
MGDDSTAIYQEIPWVTLLFTLMHLVERIPRIFSYSKTPYSSNTQVERQTHQQTLALLRLRQCPHDRFHHEGGGTHPPTTSPVTQQQHYLGLSHFR